MRANDLGTLYDVRLYPALLARSTHTADEIAYIERTYGRRYLGSYQDGMMLVPVFTFA